jgi:FecR protein
MHLMVEIGTQFRTIAAVATLCLLAAVAAGPDAAAQEKVGTNSAVNPNADGTPPNLPTRRLELGQDIVHNERVVTSTDGQTQVLFLDASAMTVGPNSDLTIDDFVYDPNAGKGKLAMSMTKGVMRFVGGKISKLEDGVTTRTPAASIGIRGGVFLLSVSPNGQVQVIFLYGRELIVTAKGQTRVLTHPGWSVTVDGPGAEPSAAAPATIVEIANLLAQLTGRPNANGGARIPPNELYIAGSNVPGAISGNFAASTQQATLNSPPQTQLRVIDVTNLGQSFQLNDVTVQPVIAAVTQGPGNPYSSAVMPPNQSTTIPVGTPISPTNPSGTGTVTPPTVTIPTTGVGSFSGTATGTVNNSGRLFQATGSYSQVYNFGTNSGISNVNNFDGANYGYSISGSSTNFSGAIASGPANRTGSITGTFTGPGATQTGGSFGVQSTAGPTYTISGTFSGR